MIYRCLEHEGIRVTLSVTGCCSRGYKGEFVEWGALCEGGVNLACSLSVHIIHPPFNSSPWPT